MIVAKSVPTTWVSHGRLNHGSCHPSATPIRIGSGLLLSMRKLIDMRLDRLRSTSVGASNLTWIPRKFIAATTAITLISGVGGTPVGLFEGWRKNAGALRM